MKNMDQRISWRRNAQNNLKSIASMLTQDQSLLLLRSFPYVQINKERKREAYLSNPRIQNRGSKVLPWGTFFVLLFGEQKQGFDVLLVGKNGIETDPGGINV